MKKYIYTKRETWVQLVAVSAEDEEEAIQKIVDGEGQDIEEAFEYSHSDDDCEDVRMNLKEATESEVNLYGLGYWGDDHAANSGPDSDE